ncbi:hypothetical protein QEN19_004403 [Hanseniaspora menglaensis]
MDIQTELGHSIPPQTNHAVSVCLPTWADNIDYEEGRERVIGALTTGYPRFFIHKSIQQLCNLLLHKYSKVNNFSNDTSENCLPFSSYNVAKRCREFIKIRKRVNNSAENQDYPIRILQLKSGKPMNDDEAKYKQQCTIACVFVHKSDYVYLKEYWQHTGEGISSRLAEYMLKNIEQLLGTQIADLKKSASFNNNNLIDVKYIEERYGRSLDMSQAEEAATKIKKRIAFKMVDVDSVSQRTNSLSPQLESLNTSTDAGLIFNDDVQSENTDAIEFIEHFVEENGSVSTVEQINTDINQLRVTNDAAIINSTAIDGQLSFQQLFVDPSTDVHLFPTGMSAIFTAHRLLLELDSIRVRRTANSNFSKLPIGYGGPYMKTVMFGFPYTDTLSILNKFNHCHFIPNMDIRELLHILQSGEQILAVFIEAPSNPLLQMCDLVELHKLSKLFGFYIVVDDTVGGFTNVDVLPYCDIVVSSLTKIFSGDSNVMAGSLVLNRQSKLYHFALKFFEKSYEYLLWCEDCIMLERNSRDFVTRSLRINENTEWIIDTVFKKYEDSGLLKKVFYPKYSSAQTKANYDKIKTSNGGYGELFSVVFQNEEDATIFFDSLNLCKGPSLGTNFTLACPYAIIAHYNELDVIKKYGIDRWLIRVSVGLEDKHYLRDVFEQSLQKVIETKK